MKMFATFVLALALMAPGAIAAEKRPLPSLTLVNATGETVTTAALSAEAQWVLVYVSPGSTSTERLIEAMKGWDLGTALRKVVFVIDARAPESAEWIRRVFPVTEENLPPRFLDAKGESRTALRVTGTPTLMGIRNGEIAWGLAGVLNDPAAVEPVIRNWIR